MKIPNAQQVKSLDEYTIQNEPIRSIDLMERAAEAVVQVIVSRWGAEVPVVVFAGPGNNGGDALAVARLLAARGYRVTAYLFNINDYLSEDCACNKERLLHAGNVEFKEVKNVFEAPALNRSMLVVDGLFGIGQNRTLTGGFGMLVKFINASDAEVVSIDMPSGMMCEDNTYNVRGHIIRATLTLTFQLPKLALLLPDNQPFVGELQVLDIGLSPQAIADLDTIASITTKDEMAQLLKPRDPFGHKGTFGHGLLVAGKYGMAGAAILAAKACLRSGVGKVTVHSPQRNNDILQLAVPEALLSHDLDEQIFTHAVATEPYTALAIGPAIGTEHETAVAFIEQVSRARIPLVIDADGINILSSHRGWLQQVPKYSVLTPHPLEFKRLGNRSIDSYSTLNEAMEMAVKQQLYIVLKGHYTAVCTPEGKVFFNPTGNSGMATAGSGDVLTGVLLALLAQKYTAENACRLAVYLHGRAGDLAAEDLGEAGVTASDLVAYLPKAFRELEMYKAKLKNNNRLSNR